MEFFYKGNICVQRERDGEREGERELVMEGTARLCVRNTIVESVRAGVR
jgi:hypothetical protein